MRDPALDSLLHIGDRDRSCAPLVAQAAQPVAEAAHIVLRQAPKSSGVQLKAEKCGRFGGGLDHGFPGMQPQASRTQILLDPRPPLRQIRRIVVKQRKIVHVAEIGCLENLSHKMIKTVEIEIAEELAGEVADRQPATQPEGLKQIVTVEVEIDRLLRVGPVHNPVEQSKSC